MRKTHLLLIALFVMFGLVLAACGGGAAAPTAAPAPTEAPAAAPTEAPAAEPTEAPAMAATGLEFLDRAMAGEFDGSVITLLGVMTGDDEEKMNLAVAPFEEATGIDVQYTGTKEFEALINTQVDAGSPPDIANISQPGLLASFARQGQVVDVTEFIPVEHLQNNYAQGWLDMSTMPGPDGDDIQAGVWHRSAGKSFVWYPKAKFDEAGYEVPTTWEELLALTQAIADDGDPAWCIGIESGAATGWVATDWIENIMLRTTDASNYDAWVAGELPFSSPEVKNAVEVMSEIWLNPDYVYGGTDSIVSIFIGDSPVPMFDDPPGCWLHIQAPWITDFFGEGLEAGVDYDFFTLPGIDPAFGVPVLVSGDIMTMFNDRPEVRALMEFFSTGAGVEQWVKAGGTTSPHQDSSLDWYADDISRQIAAAILNAEIVRFDASDLMPGEVGAGSFWKAMTDFISGSADLDTALAEIDASWPRDMAGVSSATGETAAVALPELEQAMAGEFDGSVITLLGVMTGDDEEKMNLAVAPFEEATGIDVQYTGTKEFEALINTQVDAGSPPDIANISQPGLLASFARQGQVVDVTEFIPVEHLQNNYAQGWLDMSTMPGPDGDDIQAGVWHRSAGKSFVWYPKAKFDEAGYEVPTTWEELLALTQAIADDGDPAWCIGIESGAATGWVATDWIENIMLRTTDASNYDAWVAGELPFSSPEVKNAVEVMSEIWLNPDYVYGGTDSIVSIFIGDSPVPMFDDPPGCWLHIQAPWITDFFGEGLEAGVDYDFFTLPGIDPAFGVPVLVSGDIMTMFNDRPEVRALMEFFSTGAGVEQWVKAGGTTSPHQDSSLDWYADDISRQIAAAILNAEIVRFDASDLMPGEVGAGSFWKAMTDYISGSADLDTALAEIDASWPQQ